MPKTLLHTFTGWIVFTGLLSLALLISNYVFTGANFLKVLSPKGVLEFWVIRAILTATGFIVYGFMKTLFTSWFRQKNRTNIFLIFIFYVLVLASYLLTFLMAFKKLPPEVLIDVPLMMAAVTLVLGLIPYFRNNLFSARLVY